MDPSMTMCYTIWVAFPLPNDAVLDTQQAMLA